MPTEATQKMAAPDRFLADTPTSLEMKGQADPAKPADDKEKKGAPAVSEMTQEDVDKLTDETLIGLGWKQPEKPKEEKKPDEDKQPDPPAEKVEDKKPDEKPADEKPKKPAPRKPKPELDPRELAREVAVETSKAVAEALKPAAPASTEPKLEAHELRDVEILRSMEAGNPAYKGVADKAANFFSNVLAPYRKEWVKQNPGKAFDPEEEEHSHIYEQQPDINPEDFNNATDEFRRAKDTKEIEQRVRTDLERKSAEREIGPRIQQAGQAAVEGLLKNAAPDLAPLLKEEKPLEAMAEKDPVATEILDRAAKAVRATTAEFEKLMTPELGYQFNPEKNSIHADIAAHISRYESKIRELPEQDQLWNQRKFATLADWAKMNEGQRQRHWIIQWDDVREDYFPDFARGVKDLIDKEKARMAKVAEKLGYKKVESADTSTPTKKDPPANPTNTAKPKPRPPAMSSSNDKVTTQDNKPKGDQTFPDQIVADLFGG